MQPIFARQPRTAWVLTRPVRKRLETTPEGIASRLGLLGMVFPVAKKSNLPSIDFKLYSPAAAAASGVRTKRFVRTEGESYGGDEENEAICESGLVCMVADSMPGAKGVCASPSSLELPTIPFTLYCHNPKLRSSPSACKAWGCTVEPGASWDGDTCQGATYMERAQMTTKGTAAYDWFAYMANQANKNYPIIETPPNTLKSLPKCDDFNTTAILQNGYKITSDGTLQACTSAESGMFVDGCLLPSDPTANPACFCDKIQKKESV